MSKPIDPKLLRRVDAITGRVAGDPEVAHLLAMAAMDFLVPQARAAGIEPFSAQGLAFIEASYSALREAMLIGIHGYVAHRRGLTVSALTTAMDRAGYMGRTAEEAEADPEGHSDAESGDDPRLDILESFRQAINAVEDRVDPLTPLEREVRDEVQREFIQKDHTACRGNCKHIAWADAEYERRLAERTAEGHDHLSADRQADPDATARAAEAADRRYPGARPRGSDD